MVNSAKLRRTIFRRKLPGSCSNRRHSCMKCGCGFPAVTARRSFRIADISLARQRWASPCRRQSNGGPTPARGRRCKGASHRVDDSALLALGQMRIPSAPRFRVHMGKTSSCRRIRDADEVRAARALNLTFAEVLHWRPNHFLRSSCRH